jgi:hypothetical protein
LGRRSWIAPLERTCDEIRRAGFLIERLLEPRPVEAARALDPDEFERLQFAPGFLALRVVPL